MKIRSPSVMGHPLIVLLDRFEASANLDGCMKHVAPIFDRETLRSSSERIRMRRLWPYPSCFYASLPLLP